MKNKSLTLGTTAGIVLGAGSIWIAWVYAGGGHGTYAPAKVLFPYTMLFATAVFGRITLPLMLLAFLQFPAYGVGLGLAARRSQLRIMVPVILLVLHLATVGLCFYMANSDFA